MLANLISMTHILSFIVPIVMYITTRDSWWLRLLIAIGILDIIIVPSIKLYFGTKSGRPDGATGCDIFCQTGNNAGEPAFPSGHMATTTLFVVALWLYFKNTYILLFGIPWIMAMAWARWIKRCHDEKQIIGGIMIGSLFAYILSTVSPGTT
jgi:membrane-associated phospholipid phosphatase